MLSPEKYSNPKDLTYFNSAVQQGKLLNYGHAKVTSPTYIGVKEMFACTAQDLAT